MYCKCNGLLTVQLWGSQAVCGITFRVTGGYQKAWTSFLKMVTTGSIFTIRKWSDFIEASRNFILDIFSQKAAEKLWKPSALDCRTLKKFLSISVFVLQVDPCLGRYCVSAGWLAGSAARQLDQFPGKRDSKGTVAWDGFLTKPSYLGYRIMIKIFYWFWTNFGRF